MSNLKMAREALERIAVATPNSTNSATAAQMASWTQAVAQTAIAALSAPESPPASLSPGAWTEEAVKLLSLAASDPGHFVGYKGDRSLGQWMSDAIRQALSTLNATPPPQAGAPSREAIAIVIAERALGVTWDSLAKDRADWRRRQRGTSIAQPDAHQDELLDCADAILALPSQPPAAEELYELVEALVEAEAGFELTGFDKPVPEGHSAPSGTAALLHIRKVLAKYPELVNRVWDSVKTPCEGCGKPSDFTDDDGVGTCAECAGPDAPAHPEVAEMPGRDHD